MKGFFLLVLFFFSLSFGDDTLYKELRALSEGYNAREYPKMEKYLIQELRDAALESGVRQICTTRLSGVIPDSQLKGFVIYFSNKHTEIKTSIASSFIGNVVCVDWS